MAPNATGLAATLLALQHRAYQPQLGTDGQQRLYLRVLQMPLAVRMVSGIPREDRRCTAIEAAPRLGPEIFNVGWLHCHELGW
ncbi:HNH endonuclease [Mycobacterium phage phiT45-1]|nr:HNH endonuclease [Mycobacterium phage phiT45-1]